MTGKKILTLGLALLTALALLTLAVAGAGQGKRGANAAPPEIERGMFVNRPLSSPPWYPDECEDTDSYRWAPSYHWADPELEVKVNPTGISTDETIRSAAVAAVTTGFAQWNGVGTDYSATVERDDLVSPGFDWGNTIEVSWGTIDGPGGIIAVTYYWYYVNTKELIDCDIIFDAAEPWSVSETVPPDKFDVWNIAAHEAGHTLVLADLRSPKDGALTMHAYTWPGDDFKRTLGTGDILGIRQIYGE